MKTKNKQYIIGIISILMLASTISIFVPFISNHTSKYSRNYHLNFPKKYSSISGGISDDNNQVSQILIKRLCSVVEYITNSVIPKQNKLKCLILGGTDDSGINHKKSELASFNSKTWIGKNRYSKETNATISNSVQRLKDEDKKINTIISAIKIHPYTYQAYLNKDEIIIPNIDFFINNENSITNLKSSKISNNLYTIGNTNPSINSVSLATEEATFSAKAISKSGMSLTRAVFSNISFTAKIITFNTKINGFQFASTTTIKGNDKSTSNTMIPSSNSLNTKNSEFIGTTAPFINDSFYLSSNKINLSKSLSRNNTLLINSDAVSASNYSSNNIIFGIANINYNGVSQFRYNKLLYSLLIAYPLAIAPGLFHLSVGTWFGIANIKAKGINIKKKNVINNQNTPTIDMHAHVPFVNDESNKVLLKKISDDNSVPVVERNDASLIRENKVTSMAKEAFLARTNVEIHNTNRKIQELNNKLEMLEAFESIIGNEATLSKYRNDIDQIRRDAANIERLIIEQGVITQISFIGATWELDQECINLQDRLLKLNLRVAKERVIHRNEGVKDNLEPLADRRRWWRPKRVVSQKELDLRKWHETADEYLDTLTLFRKEFVFDHAYLLIFDKDKYDITKKEFFDSVTSFLKKLLPSRIFRISELDNGTKNMYFRSIDIGKYLLMIKNEMLEQEHKLLGPFVWKSDDRRSEMFSAMIRDKARVIDDIQKEIKEGILKLNEESNDITPNNVDQHNNFIQEKIDILEKELASGLVTPRYKAEIRQNIPEMRKITQRWTEIRRNSHLWKDSIAINKDTGTEMSNIRTHEGRQFNIEEDLLAVFGADI